MREGEGSEGEGERGKQSRKFTFKSVMDVTEILNSDQEVGGQEIN